jgi:hypothetical protein
VEELARRGACTRRTAPPRRSAVPRAFAPFRPLVAQPVPNVGSRSHRVDRGSASAGRQRWVALSPGRSWFGQRRGSTLGRALTRQIVVRPAPGVRLGTHALQAPDARHGLIGDPASRGPERPRRRGSPADRPRHHRGAFAIPKAQTAAAADSADTRHRAVRPFLRAGHALPTPRASLGASRARRGYFMAQTRESSGRDRCEGSSSRIHGEEHPRRDHRWSPR